MRAQVYDNKFFSPLSRNVTKSLHDDYENDNWNVYLHAHLSASPLDRDYNSFRVIFMQEHPARIILERT